MRGVVIAALACLATSAIGCNARRVVIDPDEVHERNTPDWVVQRPLVAPSARPATPAAPASSGDAGVLAPATPRPR